VLRGFPVFMAQSKHLTQPKHLISALVICGALVVLPPVSAQRIYQEELPRPPGDVPNAPGQRSFPGQYDSQRSLQRPPAAIGNEANPDDDDSVDEPDETDDEPAPETQAPPMILPRQPRPMTLPPSRGRPIESQDLAPPPGMAPAPKATQDQTLKPAQDQPPVAEPEQTQRDTIEAPPGAPPGEAPTQGTPNVPADTVVVAPPPMRIPNPTAVFSGLDKITGRIISFDVAINETVQFGALQVTPRVCYSRAPTEAPRTDAFIEVSEVTLQGEIKRIFTGWMFAASPGLHAVEHPIYDVWLTDCKGGNNPAVAERESDQNDTRKPAVQTLPKRPARAQPALPQPRVSLPPPR
jgi:hypothetical protein